ncbi:MAG: hypothetical protein R3254_12165 [Thiomicrorhabdus sp.]|nr:hypothetical protein [Thiomicrorhabdus sp.]
MKNDENYPFINENKLKMPERMDSSKYKNLSPTDFQQQREIDWLMYETKALRHYCDNNAIKNKKLRTTINSIGVAIILSVVSIVLWTVFEPIVKTWLKG